MIDGFAERWPRTTATIFGLLLGIMALLAGIGGAWVLDQVGAFSRGEVGRSRHQWEYRVHLVGIGPEKMREVLVEVGELGGLPTLLHESGLDCWQLVSTIVVDSHGETIFISKRPKEEYEHPPANRRGCRRRE